MISPEIEILSPGEILQEMLLARNVKQSELAERMGRSPQYVTDIIKGKKAFDIELALILEDVFPPVKAEQWIEYAVSYLRSQRQYKRNLSRQDVIKNHPLSPTLLKLKWVEDSRDPSELESNIISFWNSIDTAYNYKKSENISTDKESLLAWSIQVYRLSMKQSVPDYDEGCFGDMIKDLKSLMEIPSSIIHVQKLIQSYGIRLVFLKNLDHCPVDGVASYNNGKPYLGLSLRHPQLDRFWFALMHELAHIYKRHDPTPDNFDNKSNIPDEEVEANTMAANYMIDEISYKEFVKRGKFDLASMNRFAFKNRVHVSILIGRLKKEDKLNWNQFAREHPNIREYMM